jgi:hypothetical protein
MAVVMGASSGYAGLTQVLSASRKKMKQQSILTRRCIDVRSSEVAVGPCPGTGQGYCTQRGHPGVDRICVVYGVHGAFGDHGGIVANIVANVAVSLAGRVEAYIQQDAAGTWGKWEIPRLPARFLALLLPE